ncbi:leucine-rich repeat domain-containing protein [Aquimarina sediminis]|uniref:leucine-rich repeat domain-containing protein n=1 Tax=Aquimarina sediminis TaxID=2070536 RepID=UPI000CA08B56|nr:leucine-rich repeat domain-containing protein [Aquimarina sediminis]
MFKLFTKEYKNLSKALINPLKVKRLSLLPDNNDLRANKSSFSAFKNLEHLHIHTHPNYDSEIPERISELSNLKKLSVLNIPIEIFPCWITNLKKLQYLSVRGNEITQINCSFEILTNLKTLKIENCRLSQVPKGLDKLYKLTELSFAITEIAHVDTKSLPPNLKTLNLFGINNLKENEFQNLDKNLPNVNIKI